MKILAIDTEIAGKQVGGAQLFLPGLMSGLVQRGHAVHLITKGTPNVKVLNKLSGTGVEVDSELWDADSLVDDSLSVFAEWINNEAPDVFLVSTSADMGWVVLPLLVPPIATLGIGHNDSPTYYEPARHYRNFLTRLVGVSDEICAKYTTSSGVAGERVKWIPYGVETMSSQPVDEGKEALKLVYVGRFDEEQKRISDVVKIAKALSAQNVEYVLNLVGDGESMSMVRDGLEHEIATGRVILHGWLASEEVLEIVRASEVFILASAYEGFCIALVEAMANGCAPIVTDIESGNRQLVSDGDNGFVVPIGDVDGFVDKITTLASDRAKLLDLRRKAWETGRQYSIERMVDAYEQCFTEAVADAKANPRQPDPNFPLMPSCRSKYPLWMRRIKARLKRRKSRK